MNYIRHLPNVKILLIEDKAVSKEEYDTDCYWEKGANDIKAAIGKRIDAVFHGDDYYGTKNVSILFVDTDGSKTLFYAGFLLNESDKND